MLCWRVSSMDFRHACREIFRIYPVGAEIRSRLFGRAVPVIQYRNQTDRRLTPAKVVHGGDICHRHWLRSPGPTRTRRLGRLRTQKGMTATICPSVDAQVLPSTSAPSTATPRSRGNRSASPSFRTHSGTESPTRSNSAISEHAKDNGNPQTRPPPCSGFRRLAHSNGRFGASLAPRVARI